jgi:hypothetical protein
MMAKVSGDVVPDGCLNGDNGTRNQPYSLGEQRA